VPKLRSHSIGQNAGVSILALRFPRSKAYGIFEWVFVKNSLK